MNPRLKLLLGLGFAALLARPGLAQDSGAKERTPDREAGGAPEAPTVAPEHAHSPAPATEGGAHGASAAPDRADKRTSKYDIRVKLDEDSAKGEILCRGGMLKGDAVEYDKCAKDKMDAYGEEAVKKGIVPSMEALNKMEAKKQRLAKKIAFYQAAKDKLQKKIDAAAAGQEGKAGIEHKKLQGVLGKVGEEYRKAAAECAQDGEGLKCPTEAEAGPAEPKN